MVYPSASAPKADDQPIQPPAPSWGNMIAGSRQYLTTAPWTVFAPGVALMITVLAFNFLGDGLRDVLDPKRT